MRICSFSSSTVIFVALFQGYYMYTLTRRGVPSTILALQADPLNLSKSDLGLLQSCFAITYGLSKFFGGMLTDKFSAGKIFSVGLGVAAFANYLFPLSSSLTHFCLLWGINGAFQGAGWPSLAKIGSDFGRLIACRGGWRSSS